MKLDERPVRDTIPINLIVGVSSVLVVGGGKVGERKTNGLLDCGASVELVCPDATDCLAALARDGRIKWTRREFSPEDAKGRMCVYACTDDKHVNRAVLDACRAARVLCCCADGNWAEGDFTTPAVVHADGLSVAVSTNGRSCRSARDTKNEIAAMLASDVGGDELVVVGTSDAVLPSRRRAAYHLPPEERAKVAELVKCVKGVREFIILNTCSRIEVIALVASSRGNAGTGVSSGPQSPAISLLKRITRLDELTDKERFVFAGYDAFRHLARVVAGLESSLLGEYHVVSQFKEAVAEAERAGWCGPRLKGDADEVMRASKLVRHSVEGLLHVAEIDQIAVRYLSVHGGIDADSRVCIVGTGVVGTAVAVALMGRVARLVRVYHRNRPGAICDETIVPMENLREALAGSDVVVTALDSAKPVVTSDFADCFAGRDVVMVDLGLPRNIDTSFDDIGRGVTVADLDDLKLWHRVKSGVMAELERRSDAVISSEFR